jgi:hypothetical protein
LKETSLMCDLVTALQLYRVQYAALQPRSRESTHESGGAVVGSTILFSHSSAVQLFRANGGFTGLEVRLQNGSVRSIRSDPDVHSNDSLLYGFKTMSSIVVS